MSELSDLKHLPADFNLKEQLKRDLEKASASATGTVRDRVRLSPKGFLWPNAKETTSFLNVVIVDFMNTNAHYPEKFDRNNPTPPDCYASGRLIEQLAPDSAVGKPYAQFCRDCPKNEYESGVGRAKACKNTKVLAVMAEGATAEDAPIPIITIPPAAIRYFDAYVSTVLKGRYGLPPYAVVTRIEMDQKSDYVAPRFKYERELTDAELEYFFNKRHEAETILLQKPTMVSG